MITSTSSSRFFSVLLLFSVLAVPSLAPAGEVLEEIIERNYSIEPTAKFSLKNADGSVRIYGADIDEMKLQAIKKAYSKDRLRKIDVKVAVEPGAIVIDTAYPPKPTWSFHDRSGTVDYVIILPWYCDVKQVELANGELLVEGMRGNEVHAQLGNGRLFGHNCFTDLHLALGTGGLDVGYDWWETHKIALDTNVVDGNTRVFIPGDAQFQLHAETVNGHVFSDFTNREDRPREGQTKIDLSVGSIPNARLKLQSVDGGIQINESYP